MKAFSHGIVLFLIIFCTNAEENTNAQSTTPVISHGVWMTKIAVIVVQSNRSETLNYDRLENLFDALVNYTDNHSNMPRNMYGISRISIDLLVYLVSRDASADNTAHPLKLRFRHRRPPSSSGIGVPKSGSEVVTEMKEEMRDRERIGLDVWDTLEGSLSMGSLISFQIGTGPPGKLMVWIAEDTSKYEPRDVYDQLVNRFGFKSVGLTDQELANTVAKIHRSERFLKEGVLEE